MGKATKKPQVIIDNTVLTNFALVGRPDIVLSLWPDSVATTPEVTAEYTTGIAVANLPSEAWIELPVVSLSNAEFAFSLSLSHRLGAGERACLAVAVSQKILLATDDYDARKYAQRARLTVVGTIGILISTVQKGFIHLDEAQKLLDRMIAAGYRSPITRLDNILAT